MIYSKQFSRLPINVVYLAILMTENNRRVSRSR